MLGFRVHLKHPVLPTTAYRPTRFHRPGPWNRVGCSWKCSRKQDGHEIAQKCNKIHFSFPVARYILQRFKNFKLFQNQFLLNPIHREGSESERLFAKAENVPRSHPHPGDFLRFGKRLWSPRNVRFITVSCSNPAPYIEKEVLFTKAENIPRYHPHLGAFFALVPVHLRSWNLHKLVQSNSASIPAKLFVC